jgi:hypothetical protein
MRAGQLLRWTVAGTATAILLYGLAWSSAAEIAQPRSGRSMLRLSWSARPERIEVCRTLSPAELAKREEHMRQRVECDGRFATYALRVEADGRVLHESIARGAGLRHDRPLYLLREIDLAPGTHRLVVMFTRREKTDNDAAAFARVDQSTDTGLFAGRAEREGAERARRAKAAIPPRLELDTRVTVRRDQVVVVSLDAERRSLRLLTDVAR